MLRIKQLINFFTILYVCLIVSVNCVPGEDTSVDYETESSSEETTTEEQDVTSEEDGTEDISTPAITVGEETEEESSQSTEATVGQGQNATNTNTSESSVEKEATTESYIENQDNFDFNNSRSWLTETNKNKIEGIQAYRGQFPFVALITNMRKTFFVGSIVSDRWVITSSYNFVGDHHKPFNRTDDFLQNGRVFVGGKSINMFKGFPKDKANRDSQAIRKIIFLKEELGNGGFMNYSFDSIVHLTLIKTRNAFHFGDYVRAAVIGDGVFPKVTTCIVAGYVDLRYPPAKWTLRWKRITLNNARVCRNKYHIPIRRKHVCSLGPRGRMGCTEDVGSPVLCDGKLVAMVTVRAGLDSMHEGNRKFTNGCDDPSLFVNLYELVAREIEWMYDYVVDLAEPVDVNFAKMAEEPRFDQTNQDLDGLDVDYRITAGSAIVVRCLELILALFALQVAHMMSV